MTLADEFIRSFLLHTLPDAFHCIRHYGFLDNGQRSARLALCRRLLDADPPALAEPAIDYREWYHQLTGHALDRHLLCDGSTPPQCHMPAGLERYVRLHRVPVRAGSFSGVS